MLRELHLRSNMKKVTDSGDVKKAKEIKEIISREVVIHNLRVANHVLKPRGNHILHMKMITSHNDTPTADEGCHIYACHLV